MNVIYSGFDGVCRVVIPSGELPVVVVARKDVPQGIPYKIVPPDAIPSDREFRGAWEAVITDPDGYGDPDGYWAEQSALQAQGVPA